MVRYPLLALLLILTGQVAAAPLLTVKGSLSPRSPLLKTGQAHARHPLDLPAGSLVRLTLTTTGFPPVLMVNTPEGRHFSRGVAGGQRSVTLEFVTTTAGAHSVVVTSDQPGQIGTYQLAGEQHTLEGGLAGMKSLLDLPGSLNAPDTSLRDGRKYDTHTATVAAGEVVRVQAQSSAFNAALAVTPPGADVLEADDVSGEHPEISFQAARGGTVKILVLPASKDGLGSYKLLVTGGTLTTPAPAPTPVADPTLVLAERGALGAGSARLESGEWGKLYGVRLAAGQNYVLNLEAQGFVPRLLAILPDGEEVDQRPADGAAVLQLRVTPRREGVLRFCVAASRVGQGGTFRLNVRSETKATATPVTAAPVPPVTKPSPQTKDPRLAPAPKFEGAKPLDLKQFDAGLTAPKPAPGTVQDPGVLAKTLHQMNYLCVTAGGWSEVREENWLYPKPGDTTHSSPRHFYRDLDNQFHDPQAGGYYTVPLQWTGNVFTCTHRHNFDDKGNLEMLDVTGTVSPSGDRVEWVTIRTYVQEAYWDEKEKLSLLRRRLWHTISLVDLPLRNPWHNPETGDPAQRFITMTERLKMVSPGLMTERMLNGGFHYGYDNAREAGSHVLDMGYLEQDPAVRNAPFIDRDQIHTVEYRSTHWSHAQGGDARVSFERRQNARPAP